MKFRALGEALWILGFLGACLLISAVLFPALALVFGVLLLFSMYFFRDPERQPPSDEELVVSPADGVVVEVKEASGEPLYKGTHQTRDNLPFNLQRSREPSPHCRPDHAFRSDARPIF